MSIHERIEQKLKAAFAPSHLEVENESHAHSVPKGSETHFKVVVVSDHFTSLSPVKRHQQIYAALAEELRGGVHALAITSRSPAEWAESQVSNESPRCHGGSGK